MMVRRLIVRFSLGLGLLLLLLLVTLLLSPAAFATTTGGAWDSIPLTANFTANDQPHIQGDHVVWQAYDGVDWEILLYDLTTNATRQLTHDGIDETDPRVDGDHVLWIAHERTGPVLVLYDISTDTSQRLPQNEGVQGSPEIKGDLVVWTAGESQSSEVYLYDIRSGSTTRLTNDEYEQLSPQTDGRYVVFETSRLSSMEGPSPDPQAEVYLYDAQNKTLDRLASGGAFGPQVAQGLVVWQEGAGKSAEIVLYNTASHAVTRLTTNNVEDTAPVVGGGKIAWLSWGRPDDMHIPHDSPWKVMLYDTATGKTTVASDNSLSVQIQEDGQILLWSYWNMGPEYVIYDVVTGQTSKLGPSGLANFGADLAGDRVVWRGYAPFRLVEDSTIYLAGRDGLPPAAIAPTPPVREFADIADSPYAAAIEQLARRGIARGYRTLTPAVNRDSYWLEFRPEQSALRSQFLQMLLAVAGVQATNYTNEPPFLDIQALEPTADFSLRYYVEAGLENGIIQGVSPRLFAPYNPLTRAQAVTMVMRAAKAFKPEAFDWVVGPAHPGPFVPYSGSLGDFSPVHAENMRVAEANGLLEGIVGFGPSWDPWAPITRGEAAQLLVNLASKL